MHNLPLRRVVITGMGTVSPLGHQVDEVFARLCAGESGVRAIEHFDVEGCPSSIGGVVTDFDLRDFITDRPTLRQARLMEAPQQWALAAAVQAFADSGLDEHNIDPNQLGVSLGAGLAGRNDMLDMSQKMSQLYRERLTHYVQNDMDYDPAALTREINLQLMDETNPMAYLKQCPSVVTAQIAMRYKAQGPNTTNVSLCAAGAQAIGEAAWMIARGDAKQMLAGGTDSMLNRMDLSAFARLDAVSGRSDQVQGANKPFDLQRDGCVVGEGAAMLMLEELESAQARGADIYAELVGYGTTDDAHKISAPPDDGEGAVQSMTKAIKLAGLQLDEIDHINAHGTSTGLNDRTETRAIKRVFGQQAYNIPVVSTKSMSGHLIAAAGAFEAMVSIQCLRQQRIPPTINLNTPDPLCDLDYVPQAKEPEGRAMPNLNTVLSNSFAIGGVNATLIFQRDHHTG